MAAALGWGALAASSLVLGSALALVHRWPRGQVGAVLAFGAGALISAVSFELAQEGVRVGSATSVAVGLALGALTYYGLYGVISPAGSGHRPRRGQADPNAGRALALGAFLDGIPEQAVLGIGIAAGQGVGVGLLVAIFVSNLPEAIGSASEMRAQGSGGWAIMRIWIAVALICTLASVAGYAIADVASGEVVGAINGFAAGALLVMLVDSMIPDATKMTGRTAGLETTLGFAVAAGLSALS
jgi:ZIP family zinc transporter